MRRVVDQPMYEIGLRPLHHGRNAEEERRAQRDAEQRNEGLPLAREQMMERDIQEYGHHGVPPSRICRMVPDAGTREASTTIISLRAMPLRISIHFPFFAPLTIVAADARPSITRHTLSPTTAVSGSSIALGSSREMMLASVVIPIRKGQSGGSWIRTR